MKLKTRLPRLVTPRMVVGKYPKLNAPDTYHDKLGVYQVTGDFESPEGWNQMTEKYQKVIDMVKAEIGNETLVEDSWFLVDEEGNRYVRFRMKARSVTDQGLIERKPKLYDSHNQPTNRVIGAGSIVQVAFDPYVYKDTDTNELKFSNRLFAVRVLRLVEAAPADPEQLFGDPDDEGFVEEVENVTF